MLFFIPVLMIVFVSCQKEIDWGLGNTNTANKMLVKISSKTGTTDSTTIEYSYDASKRIIREKTSGAAGGQDLGNDFVINRNGSGIITTTVQKAAALIAAGIDSVVTRFNYSTASSRYTSSIFELSIGGIGVIDSAVFAYDANGKITSDSHYMEIIGFPFPPFLALKNTYTYSGPNLVSVAQNATTGPPAPPAPISLQAYTMDSKTNPLIIGNEAIVLTRTGLFNANNPTKVVFTDLSGGGQDFTMDYTYKYNSSNKPDSSYGTRTPGGAVTATKYFYQ